MPFSILFSSFCLSRSDGNRLLGHCTKAEYVPQLRGAVVIQVVDNSGVYSFVLRLSVHAMVWNLRLQLRLSNRTMVLGVQLTRTWKSWPIMMWLSRNSVSILNSGSLRPMILVRNSPLTKRQR